MRGEAAEEGKGRWNARAGGVRERGNKTCNYVLRVCASADGGGVMSWVVDKYLTQERRSIYCPALQHIRT